MQQPQLRTDAATLRSHPDLHGIETLSARYLRQTFKPHAHEEYLFGVIEGGVHAVWCRDALHRVPAGSVVTMRPGDIHHGGAGAEIALFALLALRGAHLLGLGLRLAVLELYLMYLN